jgi:hypothetical protein
MVLKLSGSYCKNFRLQVPDKLMWFNLDLDPMFTHTSMSTQESDIWLILPKNTDCLSAGGLLGRGLCIVQIGEAENVPVPDSLKPYSSASHWTVTPSIFSTAFTCGVVNGMTEATTISSNVELLLLFARGEISKSPRFCLQADVASWPVVREERARYPNGRVLAIAVLIPVIMVIAAAIMFVLLILDGW